MIDGSYAKTGLLHALAQLPKQPRALLRDLSALFSGSKERALIYEQIERDRLRLERKIRSLSGQLSDLMKIELSGAEEAFRVLRRLINFCPSKIQSGKLSSARYLDWQMCDSELEAHRGYLLLDNDYLRVLTLTGQDVSDICGDLRFRCRELHAEHREWNIDRDRAGSGAGLHSEAHIGAEPNGDSRQRPCFQRLTAPCDSSADCFEVRHDCYSAVKNALSHFDSL